MIFSVGTGGNAMRYRIAILVCAVALSTTAVQAVGMTGKELLSYCRSSINEQYGLCVGYIMGVFDTEELQRHTCPASGVTNGEKVNLIVHFLGVHEEQRDLLAPSLVIAATQQSFPCHYAKKNH
jgi:hypothetical protein